METQPCRKKNVWDRGGVRFIFDFFDFLIFVNKAKPNYDYLSQKAGIKNAGDNLRWGEVQLEFIL